jgi:hypothetical protein
MAAGGARRAAMPAPPFCRDASPGPDTAGERRATQRSVKSAAGGRASAFADTLQRIGRRASDAPALAIVEWSMLVSLQLQTLNALANAGASGQYSRRERACAVPMNNKLIRAERS